MIDIIKNIINFASNVVNDVSTTSLQVFKVYSPEREIANRSPEVSRRHLPKGFLICRQADFSPELHQDSNISKNQIIQKFRLLCFVNSVCSVEPRTSYDLMGYPNTLHPPKGEGYLTIGSCIGLLRYCKINQ